MSKVLGARGASRPSQAVFPGRGGLAVPRASDGGEARTLAGGPQAKPASEWPSGHGRECPSMRPPETHICSIRRVM